MINCVDASIEMAEKNTNYFDGSRRQVDCKELGGGMK